jgi:alpha-pyrone synthase
VPSNRVTQEQGARIAQILCRDQRYEQTIPVLYQQTAITGRNFALSEAVVRDVLNGTRYSDSPFLPSADPDDAGPTTRERMGVYQSEAPDLAETAAARALAAARVAAADITHLVTVSCTGFNAPGVDIALIERLGLPRTTERTHVGFMGCHGALNGLRVARGLSLADTGAIVLVCAVELCSLHYHYGWDPKRVVGNALFSDGAAALVCGSGATGTWCLQANGACVFADSAHAMTWEVGDHGFTMTLSTKVPGLIASHLRPWLESWLEQSNLRLSDIGCWAVHPGGPRVLAGVGEALGLDAAALEDSRRVLSEHGNMSSPTLLFIIDRLRRGQACLPCVALGFGPGLAVEAALFS